MGKEQMCGSYLILIWFLAFGTCVGKAVDDIGIFKLENEYFSAKISNYGAVLVSLHLPDRHGDLEDVVLGLDSIDGYKNDTAYFGAIVGRVINRIGGAKFCLNGVCYKLAKNDRGNCIHGGLKGFSDVVWTVEEYIRKSHLTLSYHSYDGEEGFPGAVDVTVTYKLLGKNELCITMEAKSLTEPTPVNLASHTYWNLAGQASGDIRSHYIQIFGSKITVLDKLLIPTGEIKPVEGTAYDFHKMRTIGSRFNELPAGYDINYILHNKSGSLNNMTKAAVVYEKTTGRKLELWTNQAGVQFYTSNTLGNINVVGKGGYVYGNYSGLCLETQGFPDAVNHPNFPSVILAPGQPYKHVMVYKFTAS